MPLTQKQLDARLAKIRKLCRRMFPAKRIQVAQIVVEDVLEDVADEVLDPDGRPKEVEDRAPILEFSPRLFDQSDGQLPW